MAVTVTVQVPTSDSEAVNHFTPLADSKTVMNAADGETVVEYEIKQSAGCLLKTPISSKSSASLTVYDLTVSWVGAVRLEHY